jgi:hypothetical protein
MSILLGVFLAVLLALSAVGPASPKLNYKFVLASNHDDDNGIDNKTNEYAYYDCHGKNLYGLINASQLDLKSTECSTINLSRNNGLINGNVRIASYGSNVYVVWDNFERQRAETRDISFRRSIDDGNTFGSTLVIGRGAPVSMAPQIAASGQYVFVVWEAINIDYTTALDPMMLRGDIYLAKSSDYGRTFEKPVNISESRSNPSFEPHIAVNGSNVYIAWAEVLDVSAQNPEGATYFVSSSDNGSTFSPPLVISPTNQRTMNLQIATVANYVYVVWEARVYDGVDLSLNYAPAAVTFARSTDNGHSFESPTTLSDQEHWAQYPTMIARDNKVYITWHNGETGARILGSLDNGHSFELEKALDTVHTEPVLFSFYGPSKGVTWCYDSNVTCFTDQEFKYGKSIFANTVAFPGGCRPLVYETFKAEAYALASCADASLILLHGTTNSSNFLEQITLGELGFIGDNVHAAIHLGENLFVTWHGADDSLYFKRFYVPLKDDNFSQLPVPSDSDDKDDSNKSDGNITNSTNGVITIPKEPEKPRVLVGTGHIIDGYYVTYDKGFKATWNATSFAMYDNGTISFDMTLHYLAPNPTKSIIYNVTTGGDQPVNSAGELRYVTSIFFARASAWYQYTGPFDDFLGQPLTKLVVLNAKTIDNQTSSVSYRGAYEVPKDNPQYAEFRYYEVQLSWLRIFEDSEGNRFYQWMQGRENCGYGYCKSQMGVYNQNQTLSGSFGVYMPIPEKLTTTKGFGFDYVKWINENIDLVNIPEFGFAIISMIAALSMSGLIVMARLMRKMAK